jgi:hypothetical protein
VQFELKPILAAKDEREKIVNQDPKRYDPTAFNWFKSSENQKQKQYTPTLMQTNQSKVESSYPTVELRSSKRIDYRKLEKLLKASEWREADELTANIMCQVAGREKDGWLDVEHIEAFPCEDLQTIDQLWMHYSSGKFGFSTQKKMWLEYGGTTDKYDYEVWKNFTANVGWYHPQNDDWRTYTEFMDDTKNARNALPSSLPMRFMWVSTEWRKRLEKRSFRDWNFVILFSSLALRLAKCKI